MHITRTSVVQSVSTLLVMGAGSAIASCQGGASDDSATGSGTFTGTTTATATTATATSTTAPTSDTDSGSGGSPTTGTGSTTTGMTGGATSGGTKFDVGTALDLPPEETEGTEEGGCEKIDFLFVVDNSGSMHDEQTALAASFPGFISEIQTTVMAEDYQIMVVDTDASRGLPMGCDDELGAGGTKDARGNDCGITSGRRYMLDTQPNLSDTFTCLALLGTGGDVNERPMEALVNSVTVHNPPGQCNGGFVRDDAILVVTFITDEPDNGKSVGDPVSWRNAVVGAKNGDEEAVTMLGLIGDPDIPGGVCTMMGNAAAAPRLRTFAESFTHGSWGSVCSLNYTPFFTAAVAVVKDACDGFQPPE